MRHLRKTSNAFLLGTLLFFLCVLLLSGQALAGKTEKANPDQPPPSSPPTSCTQLLEQGNAARGKSEYTKALELYTQGLTLATEQKDKWHIGAFHTSLGIIRNNLGQYNQALQHYEQAVAIDKALGDKKGEAADLGNMGLVYQSLGQYPKALEHYQQALAIMKAIGDKDGEAANIGNMGVVYVRLGQYPKALELYAQALEIKKDIGDRNGQAASLGNMGVVYESLGQYPKALELYAQALEIKKDIGDRNGQANQLGNMGNVYVRLGQYPKALELYAQALEIKKDIGDRNGQAASLGNMGVVYLHLGQYPKALEHYQQALAITKAIGDRQGESANLGNMGEVYERLGQYPKALEHYEQALAIKKAIGDRNGEGIFLGCMGNTYAKLGEYDKAREHLARALEISQQIGAVARSGEFLIDSGDMELLSGRTDAARDCYARGLAALAAAAEPEVIWRGQHGLARATAKLDGADAAIFFGKQAVNTLQSLRQNIVTMDKALQKSFLVDEKQDAYKQLADLLIEKGRLPEAQQVLAMLKEEEFFDFVRRDASEAATQKTSIAFNAAEKTADASCARASESLIALGRELAELEKKGSGRSEQENARLKELRAKLDAAQKGFQEALNEITASFKSQGEARAEELTKKQLNTDLCGMVRALGPDVALVHYLMLPDRLRILVTTPKVVLDRKVEIKATELSRLVHEFRAALQDPRVDPAPISRKLYAALIEPIENDLAETGATTLMASLDGPLRYLPLAALQNEKGYLAQRFAVAVFTEAVRDKIKDRPGADWKLAGFGVSQPYPGFKGLDAVPGELRGIIRTGAATQGGASPGVLPGVIRLDKDFTLDSFRDALGEGYPALHIASHFKFEPGDNLSSFLLLGNGEHWLLSDLRENKYDLGDVDLITLSACETAMGGDGASGREVEGFGAMVQQKGAKAVLATLWPVADASTGLFMQDMYWLRQERKLSKAEALRQAQVRFIEGKAAATDAAGNPRGFVISNTPKPAQATADTTPWTGKEYAHPYYWAPFILMGNWL